MMAEIDWESLGAGSLGAIDEALFGIPEFALKNLGKRKEVEDYIKKHEKAYKIGETIGTIGSMFIPGTAIAKGITGAGKVAKVAKGLDTASDAFKLVKAADKVSDIAKLSKLAKGADTAADIGKAAEEGIKLKKSLDFGKLATRGALSGGLESGVRGITSEKSPSEILSDIKSGAMFGAGGGILGGAISKNLPRWASETAKNTEKAYLGTTDLGRRQALAYLKDFAGKGSKGFGKLKAADPARKELVRVAKEIGAHIPGKMDEAIFENKAMWQKLDDVVENAMPNVRGSELYTAAAEKLDLPELYKEFGKDQVNAFIQQVAKDGVDRSGLANSRKFLNDLVDASYSQGGLKTGLDQATQRMQREIAQGLRSGVDDIVMDTAKQSGVNIDFDKLKKDYLPMRAIAESGAIDSIVPSRVNMGSQTAEKLAGREIAQQIAQATGSAGIGGAAGFASGEDLNEKIRNAAIGGLGGALGSRMIGKLATKGIAAGAPLAGMAENALEKVAPDVLEKIGATTGGQAASIISRKAIEEAQPTTPQEAEAAETGATSTDTPQYMSRVQQKMQEFAVENGMDPASSDYQDFIEEVYAATDGFKPEMIGAILYPDAGEQKAYLKALEVSRGLREFMPEAGAKKAGLFSGTSDEEKINRDIAVDKLASLVGDVAKVSGSEAAAKKTLTKILNSGDDPERKAQLVKTLLSGYGVDIEEIEQMGMV